MPHQKTLSVKLYEYFKIFFPCLWHFCLVPFSRLQTYNMSCQYINKRCARHNHRSLVQLSSFIQNSEIPKYRYFLTYLKVLVNEQSNLFLNFFGSDGLNLAKLTKGKIVKIQIKLFPINILRLILIVEEIIPVHKVISQGYNDPTSNDKKEQICRVKIVCLVN